SAAGVAPSSASSSTINVRNMVPSPGAPSPGARESSQRCVARARARTAPGRRNVVRDGPRIGPMRPSAAATARPTAPTLHGAGACAALLLAALSWPGAASAQAARYEIDPVHTRVMFELSHAGYSQAIGTVSGSTGTLVFDPGDWSRARVEVSVPLLRLDLGDAKWNRAALGRNLLDGDDHPAATFVSTRVEGIDDKH